jgi:hypothetical protein
MTQNNRVSFADWTLRWGQATGAFWSAGRLGLGLLTGGVSWVLMRLLALDLGSSGHALGGLFVRMLACFCLSGVGFHLLGS